MNNTTKEKLLDELEDLYEIFQICDTSPKIEHPYQNFIIRREIGVIIFKFPKKDRMRLVNKYKTDSDDCLN